MDVVTQVIYVLACLNTCEKMHETWLYIDNIVMLKNGCCGHNTLYVVKWLKTCTEK
jgi:hypothetical protein